MTTEQDPGYAATCYECSKVILGHERIWITGRGPEYKTFCSDQCQVQFESKNNPQLNQ